MGRPKAVRRNPSRRRSRRKPRVREARVEPKHSGDQRPASRCTPTMDCLPRCDLGLRIGSIGLRVRFTVGLLLEVADEGIGERLKEFELEQAIGEKLNQLTEKYYKRYPRDFDELWPSEKHYKTDVVLRRILLEHTQTPPKEIVKIAKAELSIDLQRSTRTPLGHARNRKAQSFVHGCAWAAPAGCGIGWQPEWLKSHILRSTSPTSTLRGRTGLPAAAAGLGMPRRCQTSASARSHGPCV
eukprot:6176800-Prymnesium_polylepis.1